MFQTCLFLCYATFFPFILSSRLSNQNLLIMPHNLLFFTSDYLCGSLKKEKSTYSGCMCVMTEVLRCSILSVICQKLVLMGIVILFELATLTCSSMITLMENKFFYPFLKNKIRYPFKKEQTCVFPLAC